MKQPTTIPATSKPRKPRVKKSPAETTSISAAAETLLHIDLWTGKTSDPLEPLAAQMVTDLIRATAGDLQTTTGAAISASYKSTRQAIAAARNLCPLIEGFSTTIHAAFTLGYPGDLEHRTPSPTDPQRILLIGAICEAARTIPGLRFRELPATANRATLELLIPTRPAIPPAPTPVAIAIPKPVEVLPQIPKLRVRTSSTPSQQSQSTPHPKRRLQIFAATGAVALIALIAFFITRPSAKSQPAPTPAPVVAAVIPPTPTPQPAPPPAVVATPKPPAEIRKQPPPPPKVKQPPPERETKPAPSTSGVTFSPEEIKRMLASADKLSGDGNYDRAIMLYEAVLKVDRKNNAAFEGRQRAIYNRDHH